MSLNLGTLLLSTAVAVCALGWLTERLRASASARERRAQERTLRVVDGERRILRLIAEGASLPHILNELTAAMERLSPGCRCSILLLEDPASAQDDVSPPAPDSSRAAGDTALGRRFREGSPGTLPWKFMRLFDGLEIGPSATSCGAAAHGSVTIVASDIETDERWIGARDFAVSFGLRACWSVPIHDSVGTVQGTFAMYHRSPAVPARGDLRALEAAAQLAGNAIERLTAEQKLRDTSERLALAEETARFGVWEMDWESQVFTLSAGAAFLSGLEPVAQRRRSAEMEA